MNSFCGKSCELCAWGERIGCAGCQEGLGKPFGGPCEIAACCREKGHAECVTCGHRTGCSRLAGRDQVPQRALQRQEAERARQRELAEKAPLLGKWLWRLFWLVVPVEILSLLGSFLPMDRWTGVHPGLRWAELLLGLAVGGAQGLFLWKLGPVRRDYRIAALCQIAVAVIGATAELVPQDLDQEWLFLLGLAVIAVGLCRDYREFHAHAGVLEGVDDELAGKWRRLWVWTAGIFGGLVVGCFLVMFMGILGLLLLLALLIGLIVLIVLQMAYLWQTAKIFRKNLDPAPPRL